MSVVVLVFLQFFGITCGLSAPYVAGQIDYAMHQPNYTTVLVGFNPVTLARDTPIEKWHKTCRDVSGCMHVEGITCSLVPGPQSSYMGYSLGMRLVDQALKL